jgi:hypothetical protein
MKKYTDTEQKLLREYYPRYGASACARAIYLATGRNRSLLAIGQTARKMGLRYQGPPKGHFKHGQISHNKGKAMTAEMRAKCAPTMFKPGQMPANTKKDGVTTLREGGVTPYIRIERGRWKRLAHHVWETAHQTAIPGNHVIRHLDGDRLNCQIENLELVSRAENLARNQNKEKAAASLRLTWFHRRAKRIGATSFVDAVLKGLV